MVYVFLAEGFEEVEAITPIDYLRRCEELEVITVGVGSKTITGGHGITIECDIIDSELDPNKIDMIVLPGGMPGTLYLEKSEIVSDCIDFCIQNQLYVAAICAAPSILGHKMILNGKNAVCYPGFEEQLIGANIIDADVCCDGKIITARGAGVANQFAFTLVELLVSDRRADSLKDAIQWKR